MASDDAAADTESYECLECGNVVTPDADGYAVCWGTPSSGLHGKRQVVRPCGICSDPIRTAEICADCAEEHSGDAFTPTWGEASWRLEE